MVTAPPPPDDNPLQPDQSDTVPTDFPDIGPSQDPDAAPLDPDIDPDAEDNRLLVDTPDVIPDRG